MQAPFLQYALEWLQENVQLRMLASAASSLLIAVGVSGYIAGLWRGNVTTSAWAWTIRTGLCVMAFAAQWSAGATFSLALTGAQLVCGSVITLLAFAKSSRGKIGRLELFAIVTTAVFGVAWLTTHNAALFMVGAIMIDFAATAVNARNMVAQKKPDSAFLWLCSLAAAMAAAVSVGGFNIVLLQPAASAVNALVMLGLIVAAHFIAQSARVRELELELASWLHRQAAEKVSSTPVTPKAPQVSPSALQVTPCGQPVVA